MEKNKIHNKDCIEGLKSIEDNSIDCIIIDPPYGINYHSGHYKNGNPHKPIANDDTLFIPIDDLWRVLKPTGAMFIFFSHKVPLIDKRVKNVIIWVKNNWTAGDLYKDFGNQYECIAYMPKEDFKLHSKRFSNVWKFDRISADNLLHPTQKPESIIRRLIETATEKGDLVLDCFIGSGTTAVACKQMERKFIGFEIDKSYVDIAERRLSQKTLSEVSLLSSHD
jgi:site-specific DNA-methyltransferase (adenine-specific)|tara:strand:+ start:93 stop:761 length:669 start_codon:yes stop_codon:yes gene_type:complete